MAMKSSFNFVIIGAILASLIYYNFLSPLSFTTLLSEEDSDKELCPIIPYHRPSTYEANLPHLRKIMDDEAFRNQSLVKLQGSVRVKTETHDDDSFLVEDDPEYWSKFDKFESYLHATFPVFYKHVELHKVNYHGLVYIWKGTNETLKPLLFMAHQDTVPVPEQSLKLWEHDPFAAEYDGTYVYGRGVADCKNMLIAELEAVEELVKIGFVPKRTVIFSFGFDEEVGGIRNQNAQFLESVYGNDSMYAIFDEGGVSLLDIGGTQVAIPGTSEKGYLDLKITLETPGGHSSTPPRHTAIGIIGDLIVEAENDEFPTYFTEDNPAYWQYVCLAEHSRDIDADLKWDILHASRDAFSNERVKEYIDQDRKTRYAIRTTQSLDIVEGGTKVNALPEHVELTINNRIIIEESIVEVKAKYIKNVLKIAEKYDLGVSYSYYGSDLEEIKPITERGGFLLDVIQYTPVAPLTPTNDTHWDIFAGTVRHVYEELAWPELDKPVIISPGIGSGNTDTKLYWNLSNHIYRYRPGEISSVNANAHGVNEYIKFDSHLQIIATVFEYIQSVDEADE